MLFSMMIQTILLDQLFVSVKSAMNALNFWADVPQENVREEDFTIQWIKVESEEE